MNFLELPDVMIEHVLSYLSYDEIAKIRLVSRSINEISMRMLNRGFMMIERRHSMALKNVKAQLPRRESERRYHNLSRHCDILTSIETRLSMLSMTYSKYIEHNFCCFIPGKVLDEIKRVLAVVQASTTPPRAHEVLQELRDISSMAIEHFDDKVSPEFRLRMHRSTMQPVARPTNGFQTMRSGFKNGSQLFVNNQMNQNERLQKAVEFVAITNATDRYTSNKATLAPLALRQEMSQLRRRSVLNAKLSLFLASQYKIFCKQNIRHRKIVAQQQKMIRSLKLKQREQENVIDEMKKRIEEFEVRHNELLHTNQAVGGKAIAANVAVEVPAPAPSQSLRHVSSQIKLDLSVLPIGTSKRNNKPLPNMRPRQPLIRMPTQYDDYVEPTSDADESDDDQVENLFSFCTSESGICLIPSSKRKSTLDKIRGIADEMGVLCDLPNNYDNKLKRPLASTSVEHNAPDSKILKLD